MDRMARPSSRRVHGAGATVFAALFLAGCQSSSSTHTDEIASLDESPIFASSEYGVPVSPRVTNLKRVERGGGREQIGRPYQVRGKWYRPREEEPGHTSTGKASWYGSNFHGRLTANGETYDMYYLSAAHPTFPLPSYARVTNKENGHSVMVRVNDRGPFAHGRVVDLSQRAAEVLDFRHAGVADVKVEYMGRAPLEGDDGPMLMASFRPGGASPVDDGLPSGVMIASTTPAPQAPMSAASYAGATPLPGVLRPAAAGAIETGLDAAFAPVPATASPLPAVPVPTLRGAVMSYAPAAVESGSFRALAELAAAGEARRERVQIGTVENIDLLLRIHATVEEFGTLVEDASGEGSLTLVMNAGEDADAVLTALWSAGATDAFVLRD